MIESGLQQQIDRVDGRPARRRTMPSLTVRRCGIMSPQQRVMGRPKCGRTAMWLTALSAAVVPKELEHT